MGLFAVPRKLLAAQHIYALCADEPKENELPVPPNAVSCVSCRPFHRVRTHALQHWYRPATGDANNSTPAKLATGGVAS